MNELDKTILTQIQREFPLAPLPFETLGTLLHISPSEVMEGVTRIKSEGYIRAISSVFDTASLGYSSTLVAFRVAPAEIDHAAEAINAHPGVSHNYLRDNDFNVWFTLAVPPGVSIDQEIAILAREAKAAVFLNLPTITLYKLLVTFDLGGIDPQGCGSKQKAPAAAGDAGQPGRTGKRKMLNAIEMSVVNVLQEDLEISERPFEKMAQSCGLTEEEFFANAGNLKKEGVLRRYAAQVHHLNVGFNANAMVVWRVPEGMEDEVGQRVAKFKEVSHCYRRPTCDVWPYAIFSMVHAKERSECDKIVSRIAREVAISDYQTIYSTRELKKARLKYFTDAYPRWKAAHPAMEQVEK